MRSMFAGRKWPMKHPNRQGALRKAIFCCGPITLLLFGNPAGADEDAEHAHDLHAAGTIRSLEYFIDDAHSRHPGRLIDAKLHYEEDHGHYVYEILILDRRGEVWELEYDARSGVLIEKEPGGD